MSYQVVHLPVAAQESDLTVAINNVVKVAGGAEVVCLAEIDGKIMLVVKT